jgi:hypothetical protein
MSFNFKDKKVIVGGIAGGAAAIGLGIYFYLKRSKQTPPDVDRIERPFLDRQASLNTSSQIILPPNPDEIRIVEEDGILTAETVREMLTVNLKNLQDEFLEILLKHRALRRAVEDKPEEYSQNLNDYYNDLSALFKDYMKYILEQHYIPKSKWIDSLKYHVKNGNKVVSIVLERYEEMMLERIEGKKGVTVEGFKTALIDATAALHRKIKDDKWKPITSTGDEYLAIMGIRQAWDEVYKLLAYEEEDILNRANFKPDDEEIPILLTKYQDARNKFISHYGGLRPLKLYDGNEVDSE